MQMRDSLFQLEDLELVKKAYEAMVVFDNLAYEKDNQIIYKMSDGECAVFDNRRILHGRIGYEASKGSRLLQGMYTTWDEIRSRRNCILQKLDDKSGHGGCCAEAKG